MKELNSGAKCMMSCLCLLLAGCATVDLPKNLPTAEKAMTLTNGGWVVVTMDDNGKRGGELIALEPDTMFIMDSGSLLLIPRSRVTSAKIFLTDYPLKSGGMAAITFGGMASSFSLGWGAVFALPLWLIVGSFNSNVVAEDADKGDFMSPPAKLSELTMYARFPQGLPAGVKRSEIRPIPPDPSVEPDR
jgi:hypothetical protein